MTGIIKGRDVEIIELPRLYTCDEHGPLAEVFPAYVLVACKDSPTVQGLLIGAQVVTRCQCLVYRLEGILSVDEFTHGRFLSVRSSVQVWIPSRAASYEKKAENRENP